MILACNLNTARFFVPNRMVGTTMTELQFVGLGTEGQSQKLIAQANAYARLFTDDLFNFRNDIRKGLGRQVRWKRKSRRRLSSRHLLSP